MAAAIAVRLADMGFDVHLTTSDPAAHLEYNAERQPQKPAGQPHQPSR
ncbi:hypothetical protein LNO88_28550 [Klebsiella pneumoniae subsp. pneumoniae]|nr:hypothetical protein [Klebsiella pneumoniae subsp. pneumoniae]